MNFQVKGNAVIHNNTSNFIATVVKCIFFLNGEMLLPGVLEAVLLVHQWRLCRVPLTAGGSDARHLQAQCV